MSLLVLTVSPQRIVIGGGVMQNRPMLLPMIQARTSNLLAGYVVDLDTEALAGMIVSPSLSTEAGPLRNCPRL